MCTRARQNGRYFTVGDFALFYDSMKCPFTGIYGIAYGIRRMPNARMDNLYWWYNNVTLNRGITVFDDFYERGFFFGYRDHQRLVIPTLYTVGEFAIVTTQATGELATVHYRMPAAIAEGTEDEWIHNGIIYLNQNPVLRVE